MPVEVWSACDHFVQLTMLVIESSSFLLRVFFSPDSENPLKEEDL